MTRAAAGWCLAVLVAAPAIAQAQDAVEVQDVVVNEAPAEDRPWLGSSVGLWVDRFDLAAIDRRFDAPEVSALAGRDAAPNGAADGLGRTMVTGFVAYTDFQPTPWLRLPQIRLYLGGADLDGRWHRPDGAAESLEVRAMSAFVLRLELAAGVQKWIGPVAPFALARIGYGGWWVDVEVRDEALGPLGEETIADGGWEGGFELGAAVRLGDEAQLVGAYRRSLLGPADHGVLLAVSIGSPPAGEQR